MDRPPTPLLYLRGAKNIYDPKSRGMPGDCQRGLSRCGRGCSRNFFACEPALNQARFRCTQRAASTHIAPINPVLAATNKSLAQMNKSGTAGKATKKARNPASRVDPMGADHRVVPAIKQALSMLPQPWSQRAMLTSNDYKELAARCAELASESSEPAVAEALRALASDYLARAAKLHFVFLEQGTRLQGMSIVGADKPTAPSRTPIRQVVVREA